MDGKIEVVSQSGEGSTFRFYVRASLVTNAKYSSQENLVLVEETKSEEGNASKKVLIVEGESVSPRPFTYSSTDSGLPFPDNLINQKGKSIVARRPDRSTRSQRVADLLHFPSSPTVSVLKRQLAKAGFLPDVASDGREALASVRTAEEKGERYLVVSRLPFRVLL